MLRRPLPRGFRDNGLPAKSGGWGEIWLANFVCRPDRALLAAAIFPRAPIDWQRKNFPDASYPEIKNHFDDEEKASPVRV